MEKLLDGKPKYIPPIYDKFSLPTLNNSLQTYDFPFDDLTIQLFDRFTI